MEGISDGRIYWPVAEYVGYLKRQSKLPIAIVTGRAAFSNIMVRDTIKLLGEIERKLGWAPEYIIMREDWGSPYVTVPEYKVRELKRHHLRPVVAIDDMPEVLAALQGAFGTKGILAQAGRLIRVGAAA